MNPTLLSRLSIGTAQFGLDYGIANASGRIPSSEAQQIVDLASSLSIKTVDTAAAYGCSEITLGNVLDNNWDVITKIAELPSDTNNIESWVRGELTASLANLKRPCIYGVLIHNAQDLLGVHGDAIYSALKIMKDCGMAKKIGVSVYSPEELTEITNAYSLDLVQVPFNVFDQRFANKYLLSNLKKQGIEIHARSIFMQGLLLNPDLTKNKYFRKWKHLWKQWQNWLVQSNVSAVSACLHHAMQVNCFDRIIVGIDSIRHLEQIAEATCEQLQVRVPPVPCTDEPLINPRLWTQ